MSTPPQNSALIGSPVTHYMFIKRGQGRRGIMNVLNEFKHRSTEFQRTSHMNAIAVGWRVVGSGGDALTPTVRSRLIQSNFNDLSADISCAWIDGILYRIPWPPFPLADARKKKNIRRLFSSHFPISRQFGGRICDATLKVSHFFRLSKSNLPVPVT